jgi:hypothetical protein
MAKHKKNKTRAPILRSSRDVLSNEILSKSRIAKIKGSNILFLVSPQILANKHATRHLTFLTRVGNENVLADGELRAKFWSVNFFDPSDWFAKFEKMDQIIQTYLKNKDIKVA